MYHVYCEVQNVETVTPDYNDAYRIFKKYIREYPNEVVDFDKIENLGKNDTMQDIVDGIYEGNRVRVMQCCPD